MLLPDEGRLSGYSVVENVNGHFVLLPNHKKEDLDLVEEIISANAFHVENYLFMLEEYCRIQDIKLFISTYNENNSTNKQHDILNNYYPYNGDSEKRFLKKYQEETVHQILYFLPETRSTKELVTIPTGQICFIKYDRSLYEYRR